MKNKKIVKKDGKNDNIPRLTGLGGRVNKNHRGTLALNKKAVADILITLVLIVITISAVLLTYNVFASVLSERANIQESPEFNCLELQLTTTPAIEITNSCYNSETNEHEITIRRTETQNVFIDSVLFTFDATTQENQKQTFVWECSEMCSNTGGGCSTPKQGEAKTYYFAHQNPENVENVKVFLGSCELDKRQIVEC